mmetsp:Transcript_8973/g.26955  ORF Transcript_8973/g.26955 Transcript_8973/m.26955 type:complete len:128 (-) Transcript_8973:853-1236(-)|eukprot:CAMPEP_0198737636 /NCGR_PEP_ID=MMETSP1475-20131203/67971_1 /TAXON_ID= ORGANISM="Unidentified sp., Strain CCMP1999" /NCGR_SAMPLE_ID=MMETSP1475 /ASSEMBLY_ACC=CAM_ASM_001111 /LENGTH=127 /DNA_ID=CAMNT_0044501505 /DNA_START=71 /DNA_END=454 /DNA_ORIENTATION=+
MKSALNGLVSDLRNGICDAAEAREWISCAEEELERLEARLSETHTSIEEKKTTLDAMRDRADPEQSALLKRIAACSQPTDFSRLAADFRVKKDAATDAAFSFYAAECERMRSCAPNRSAAHSPSPPS